MRLNRHFAKYASGLLLLGGFGCLGVTRDAFGTEGIDQGPIPAGTPASVAQPGSPAAVGVPLGGPMPEDRHLPVNSKELNPSSANISSYDRDIRATEKKLHQPHLSSKRREALEKKLADLNAKKLSQPALDTGNHP